MVSYFVLKFNFSDATLVYMGKYTKNNGFTWWSLICLVYDVGYTIEAPPAPSGGPGLLFLMNVLDEFGFGDSDEDTTLYYHNLIEVRLISVVLYNLKVVSWGNINH